VGIKALSKKRFFIKKIAKAYAHLEGKCICDCLVKNYRKWLGIKRYGQKNAPSYKEDSQC
jgi:hypothetical protein